MYYLPGSSSCRHVEAIGLLESRCCGPLQWASLKWPSGRSRLFLLPCAAEELLLVER